MDDASYVGAAVWVYRGGWLMFDKGRVVVEAPLGDDTLLSVEVPDEPLVYLCIRASRLVRMAKFNWFVEKVDG